MSVDHPHIRTVTRKPGPAFRIRAQAGPIAPRHRHVVLGFRKTTRAATKARRRLKRCRRDDLDAQGGTSTRRVGVLGQAQSPAKWNPHAGNGKTLRAGRRRFHVPRSINGCRPAAPVLRPAGRGFHRSKNQEVRTLIRFYFPSPWFILDPSGMNRTFSIQGII